MHRSVVTITRSFGIFCAAAFIWNSSAAAAVPAAPSKLRANESSPGHVDLSWRDNSSNELDFQLQSRPDPGTFATIGTANANSTTDDTTIPADAVRVFRVRARNGDGNSRWSNLCWLNANPARPTGLHASPRTAANVHLEWDDESPNETGFQVQRRVDGGSSWTTLARLNPDTTALEDTTANASTAYEYRVRALGRARICIANSRWSSTLDVSAVQSQTMRTLTVTKSGTGSGTVASNPAGISCGSTCSAQFGNGSVVVLTAAAGSGSSFTGWSGACAGVSPSCQVTLSTNKSATASFQQVTSSCPTNGPLTDLRRNCASRAYVYGNPVEEAELVTNGNSIVIYLSSDFVDAEAVLYGSVTSATSFHYDEACVPGFGCADVDETGAIQNSGNTLRINLQGEVYTYSFIQSFPASFVATTSPEESSSIAASAISHIADLVAE
jgi:hypothetical protein